MTNLYSILLFRKRFTLRLRRSLANLLNLWFIIVLGLSVGKLANAQDAVPWNRLYVTNFDSNTVSVVDLNLSRVIADIPVGLGPTGMALAPDLEHVYVANMWSGDVSVIATASNSVEKSIPIPSFYGKGAPFGMAMTPDGSRVLVTNLADGTIRVISTQTNTVTATITSAYDWALRYIAISPDGEYVYAVGTGEGKITVLRLSDYSVVGRINNLPSARHLAFTPDGSRLYVTSDKYDRLYVLNAATYALITTIFFPRGAGTITVDIAQSGKFAMVSNYQEKVSIIDIDPRSPTYHRVIGQIPPNSGYQYCIVISPEGRFAYLSNQSDRGKSPNSINVIDITPDSPTCNSIIYSIPVGRAPWGIAIVRQNTNSQQRLLRRLDETEPRDNTRRRIP